jgi:hypothetical protein
MLAALGEEVAPVEVEGQAAWALAEHVAGLEEQEAVRPAGYVGRPLDVAWAGAVYRRRRVRGSRASRRPSPRRLNPRTRKNSASPGHTMRRGAVLR